MDYRQMTAPCGLDCFNCPMYIAGENEELRAAVAKNMGSPLEQATCQGCRDETGTIAFLGMSEPCNVYKCTQEKGIGFCCDCSESPCGHLHPYADMATQAPHNTKVFNLCLIKKMGLEPWARTKARSVRDTYFNERFRL